MPPSETNGVSPSLSDAINKLMANPEIISTVASALGNMAPKQEAESSDAPPTQPSDTQPPPTEKSPSETVSASAAPDLSALVANLAPIMSGMGGAKGSQKTSERREADKRVALLCALKPYVSEGRREAIDYIIRISQISDILKNIQR